MKLSQLTIRKADDGDLQRLANLIHFEPHVHRHLDWRPPLDWIGQNPYLVLEQGNRLQAALACPPDPPNVAWIRLFAVSAELAAQDAWNHLWSIARQELGYLSSPIHAAAIPLQSWFQQLLDQSAFTCSHRVVVLAWRGTQVPKTSLINGAILRSMSLDDIPAVGVVDAGAFGSLWQNSLECIEVAYRQAAVATVYELSGEIIGYQISTATPMGGHLARLAVKPNHQGKGVGNALVADLISQFIRRGAYNITVNTQNDNLVSLALYHHIGFRETGEDYPVYQCTIP